MSTWLPASFCLSGQFAPDAPILAHDHDPQLVLLAFLIAAFASYVALNLGERIRSAVGLVRFGWLCGAACSMGGGIWSMHFIAMLAFSLQAPVSYDPAITVLSLLVAVSVTGVALHLVGRPRTSPATLLLGGTLMGLGVAAMHYVGMLAMRMVAVIEYDTRLFAASIVIAIAAATVALYLAFNLRFGWQRAAAAVVMAVAICGMHYTGMMAASFRWPSELELLYYDNEHGLLAVAVALGTQMILLLALLLVFVDRKLGVANDAARAKSAFLAAMSHEIRTPMNGVIGMIELLERSGLRADQMKMLSTIRGSSFSLLRIIDDILDFSKVEAGKLDIERVNFDPLELVEGALAILAPAAASKGLRLIGYSDPSLPAHLLGDPTRLRQILLNLGGNAIKFTAAGRVVIRAERAGELPDGSIRLRLSVSDTGIGIADGARMRLFRPFSQAEPDTTRRYGGTGLGLSICHRLTMLMGGEIGVDSRTGEGSRFWVVIPLRAAAQPVTSPAIDIADLSCVVASADPDEALVLRRYLDRDVRRVTLHRVLAQAEQALDSTDPNQVLVADAALVSVEWLSRQPRTLGLVLITDPGTTTPVDVVRLDRPIRRTDLREAVALAAGRQSPIVPAAEIATEPSSAEPSREAALAEGRLLLVAEDHETNRLVLGGQLRRLGYAADFTCNGAEALEAATRCRYAALLTDCHMPEMDGFDLTRRLRASEAATGRHMPIIAVTANALRGEAERCFATGMDDFVSKPVVLRELKRVLTKWIPGTAAAATAPPASTLAAGASQPPGTRTIDHAALLELVGGDTGLAGHVLRSFARACSDSARQIAEAVESRDTGATVRRAHTLKGAARTACAAQVGDIAAVIESAATDGDWPTIDRQLPELTAALEAVGREIDALPAPRASNRAATG